MNYVKPNPLSHKRRSFPDIVKSQTYYSVWLISSLIFSKNRRNEESEV